MTRKELGLHVGPSYVAHGYVRQPEEREGRVFVEQTAADVTCWRC